MAKLIAAFLGVPSGQIYPVQFQAGDECPAELEAAALALGVLGDPAEPDAGSVPAGQSTGAQVTVDLDPATLNLGDHGSAAERPEVPIDAGLSVEVKEPEIAKAVTKAKK